MPSQGRPARARDRVARATSPRSVVGTCAESLVRSTVDHAPSQTSTDHKEHFMSDDQPTDVVAALSDGAFTLFVADFTDTDTAWQAYETLKSVEDGKTLDIEG